jgi:hypothetical protein
MKFLTIMIGCGFTLLHAVSGSYIDSYTARISRQDHFSSRGNYLGKVSDILQQDRANYHRFGLRDSEDEGDRFFYSLRNRSRMGYLLRRGWIEPGLGSEIERGTPLVKVDVYRDHIEVRRASEATPSPATSTYGTSSPGYSNAGMSSSAVSAAPVAQRSTPGSNRGEIFDNPEHYLVAGIVFPTKVVQLVRKLGPPDEVDKSQQNDGVGTWFVWRLGGAVLSVLVDDPRADRDRLDYETRGAFLVSAGYAVRSLYGVKIGVDDPETARKKVMQQGMGARIEALQYLPEGFSHVLRFRDPSSGLYNVFYFKNGVLQKIWQGSFDMTRAS